MNMTEQVSVEFGCRALWADAKELYTGSRDRFTLNTLKILHTCSRVVASMYIPTKLVRVVLSPHPCQCSFSVLWLIVIISTGAKWDPKVILTFMFPIAKDGYFFECSLVSFTLLLNALPLPSLFSSWTTCFPGSFFEVLCMLWTWILCQMCSIQKTSLDTIQFKGRIYLQHSSCTRDSGNVTEEEIERW